MADQVRIDRRPLWDTAPDADLFVGRVTELGRLRRSVELGLNAMVVGSPGAGKSSLLRHLAWLLRREGVGGTLFLPAAGMREPAEFLRQLLRRVAGDEAAALAQAAGTSPAALIERLGGLLSERAVVLVDDLPAELGRTLFGALRDEVWRWGVSWVVAAADDEAGALLRPPTDVFFETVVRLAPLTPAEAAELLRRRGVRMSAEETEVLARLAGGIPRRLVDLARTVLVDGRPVAELTAAQEMREHSLGAVSVPARELAAVLADVGSASPSDRTLQERMGVTRPRLVALFAELRQAGVVVELPPDRSGGKPGRPRTRFALATATPPELASETVGGPRDTADDVH